MQDLKISNSSKFLEKPRALAEYWGTRYEPPAKETPIPLPAPPKKKVYDLIPIPLPAPPKKKVYDLIEYNMVPEPTPKETPIALGPPTPKPTPTPTPKPTPSPTPRPTLVPTPTKTQAPEAVNIEIPKVAETPVLLPTTKYSIFDMFKNKTSVPKPTHQTAPPGTVV